MKETKIQVAAPSGGLYYGTEHSHTDWQRYSDSFKALGQSRLVYPITTNEQGLADPRTNHLHHTPLRTRHIDPTVRGKWQIKAAKKARRAK